MPKPPEKFIPDPILPINKDNFAERNDLFLAATAEASKGKSGNFVTPGTVLILGGLYGGDVVDKALDEKIIAIG